MLGRDAAIDLLKATLRVSADVLLAGQSFRLARDRVGAEVVQHLERVDRTLLAVVLRQIGLAQDLAVAVSRHIGDTKADTHAGKQLALRAGRIEQKADRIAIEARGEIARLNARPLIGELVDCVEQAIDELEQAAFHRLADTGSRRHRAAIGAGRAVVDLGDCDRGGGVRTCRSSGGAGRPARRFR